MRWVQSGEYDRIIRGEYRTRDQEVDVGEEASDAMSFYAERFRTIFQEAGDNLANLGTQVGGMAEQLGDWLRKRGGPGGFGGFGGPGGSAGSGGTGGSEPAGDPSDPRGPTPPEDDELA
jgi:hypothetical protein